MNGDLDLVEFERRGLARGELTEGEAGELCDAYGRWIEVEWPSPRNGSRWTLRPRGVVGHLPLASGRVVRVHPKLPVARVWALVEATADVRGLTFLDGTTQVAPADAIYARVVSLLAKGVERRARVGFAHAYESRSGERDALRGRLDVAALARRPATHRLPCVFDEHTGDTDDNRILAAALARALRGPLRDPDVRRRARRAWGMVTGVAAVVPMRGADCDGRSYTRLTADYERLHALSRFVLDALAPSERAGDRAMVPFVLDMARVFERFVARWLRDNLGAGWEVFAQRRVHLAGDFPMTFQVDVVLRDRASGRDVAVIDTKYRGDGAPSDEDVQQVVAYATALRCRHAFLVYPRAVRRSLRVGEVAVHACGFDLARDDLDAAGEALRRQMLPALAAP